MPQLYAQCASRPDPWLIGRTSAGLCTLQTACPLTVTYSGGSPAADTIAAGSAATVYGGSATVFDASSDVWVVLTVPGSGALQVTKEADLATVTGDWAGLARVVQHSTEPYQPQASLAVGGLGNQQAQTIIPLISDTSALCRDLWNGSSNNAPPASWQTSAYDDSAWSAAVISRLETVEATIYIAGTHPIWPTASSPTGVTAQALFRQHVVLPAGLLTGATLEIACDDVLLGLWINGTAIASGSMPINFGPTPGTSIQTLGVPAGVLLPGADNVIATWVQNDVDPPTGEAGLDDRLTVSYAGAGTVLPAPASPAEGDLLYYHNGAWVRLPIAASGRLLTSNGTDPGWAAPATSGTVTSVQVAVPAPLSASGGPLTSSGTITLAWSGGQTQNRVLASPDGATGAVSLRALVGADIPVDASTIISSAGTIKGNYQAGSGVSISGNTISATGSGGSVTSVALTLPSSVFSTSGSPVTTAGTLAVSLQSQALRTFWGGPASGSSAAPTFRALQSSDLPKAAGAGGRIHAHGRFL